jgi:hypothetical protein
VKKHLAFVLAMPVMNKTVLTHLRQVANIWKSAGWSQFSKF